jgi:hypothetical protein
MRSGDNTQKDIIQAIGVISHVFSTLQPSSLAVYKLPLSKSSLSTHVLSLQRRSPLLDRFPHPRHRVPHVHRICVSNGMVVPRQVLMRVAPVRVQHARRDIRVTFKTMAMFCFSQAACSLASARPDTILHLQPAVLAHETNDTGL